MSQHQPEPDPLKPDPPHQASDAEPLPTPAEESAGYLFSYYYVPSVTAYHYSEAGGLARHRDVPVERGRFPGCRPRRTDEAALDLDLFLGPRWSPEPQP
jgi:hypothetical protein